MSETTNNPSGAGLRSAYLRLMRLDRPVGTLLLLWPTLAALWMAAEGTPPLALIAVFTVGTFVMRSAGCVINDVADRQVDPNVRRTRARPLATGELSVRDALTLFVGLCVLAALLLLLLNDAARLLAVGGLFIAVLYPFMKRWTHLPQVVLGAAFSWGIVMAFAAVQGHLSQSAWLMFVASLLWIVAYDTLYAMVDREDDLKIGVKSTAILFGDADRLIVGILQVAALCAFWLLGRQFGYGPLYLVALAVMAGAFIHQQRLIRKRDPAKCFVAFTNNIWVGFALFAGTLAELYLGPLVPGPH
ncbi:MAG: 4-hydroxybenzoate octaprenyltransferase [Pseudomonadales bacterium]|jgi:4-hydroxybenzoate polyprenyltransferase|nr:4-hydroxybenzoate octaprenyltransferase [Pseudomonadales bacterium]MDP6469423.1 4-hydroxybenzoate octaprenyltransferase [Pseudomonadales bacterium]MDP6827265.1 4-hydroxybenzoate octaprenyltransferase [Pseudomonadales bacterium]MDP6971088.1 4-hydroxybenzoate octaprenyltransferase [Pseudomonadales bacterium]|tara:strand:+ start:1055 stop:1960 length:906 start_codon:yes stop_codon:yes gene_type:complete